MYLLMRVKSLMSLKVLSNLGVAKEKSKSEFVHDFFFLRTKVSILGGYLEFKFEVFITCVLHIFCFKFGFK